MQQTKIILAILSVLLLIDSCKFKVASWKNKVKIFYF